MSGAPLPFRAGFVALLGKPNAGKSTLANALVGGKIAAVSGLPQTTRDRIHGIVNGEGFQLVLADLPGLIEASDKLNESLRARVVETLGDVDAVIHLVDCTDPDPVGEDMAAIAAAIQRPMVFCVSKLDRARGKLDARAFADAIQPTLPLGRYAAFVAVSAQTGANLRELLEAVRPLLPEGPPLFDPDDLTDRNLRFLCAELIREKVYHFTHEEIPYSTAVEIEAFEERTHGKWFISAVVHVERDTQKGIVIGERGSMLKRISQAARVDIEELTQALVFLQLHVKVSRDWRRNAGKLREFGYEVRRGK